MSLSLLLSPSSHPIPSQSNLTSPNLFITLSSVWCLISFPIYEDIPYALFLFILSLFNGNAMQMMMQAKAASSSSSSSSSSHSQHEESDHSHLQLALSLTLSPHPSSSQVVVGWPPLGPYRMNTYSSSHAKSPATQAFNSMLEKSKGNSAVVTDSDSDTNSIVSKEKRNLISRNSLFVKVKMDGMPIGRKVDLSAHSSYETLAQTLEDMFNEPPTVLIDKGSNGEDHGIIVGADRQSKLLDGSSNFVLTYEDKEGDWMLVGDVPWWMFLSSVRRLRIMRTSECNGFVFQHFLLSKCDWHTGLTRGEGLGWQMAINTNMDLH